MRADLVTLKHNPNSLPSADLNPKGQIGKIILHGTRRAKVTGVTRRRRRQPGGGDQHQFSWNFRAGPKVNSKEIPIQEQGVYFI